VGARHPEAGRDYPRNWHELLEWFPDDRACLRFLERLRWADGFVCRFCGTRDADWWQMSGLRRCTACRSETSVTAGTIFAGTRAAGQLVRGGLVRRQIRRMGSAPWGFSASSDLGATGPRGPGCIRTYPGRVM